MKIKDRIENWCHASVDTTVKTAEQLMQGGMEPIPALQAAGILTKSAVTEELRRQLANRNAAEITTRLRDGAGDPTETSILH